MRVLWNSSMKPSGPGMYVLFLITFSVFSNENFSLMGSFLGNCYFAYKLSISSRFFKFICIKVCKVVAYCDENFVVLRFPLVILILNIFAFSLFLECQLVNFFILKNLEFWLTGLTVLLWFTTFFSALILLFPLKRNF